MYVVTPINTIEVTMKQSHRITIASSTVRDVEVCTVEPSDSRNLKGS